MTPLSEIAKILNRTKNSVSTKIYKLNLEKERGVSCKYSSNYRQPYRDYDWCYERFVNQRKSLQDMADELGVTKRVVEKWCANIHKINDYTLRHHLKLNDIQRQLIIWGTLGDGHINKRENQPLYLESHAEDEKDYIYWKYEILKNICRQPPVPYPAQIKSFNGKQYLCQSTHRMGTMIIDDLANIRSMSKIEKISTLDELGLSLYLLDDGSRDESQWSLCVASFSEEEKDLFIKMCRDKFNIHGKIKKDIRYISFDVISSRVIDKIILRNIPNNLDIIYKKILSKKIYKEAIGEYEK